MHDKLKILLDKINLDENNYSYFNDGILNKVLINKDAKKSCFMITLEKMKEMLNYI